MSVETEIFPKIQVLETLRIIRKERNNFGKRPGIGLPDLIVTGSIDI